MKKMYQLSTTMLLVVLISLTLTSCKKEDDPEPPIEPTSISLSAGEYLVDGNNQTLYFFTRDVDGKNNCSGGCVDFWPAYHEENINFGQGLDATDFAELDLADGSRQITYKGWPLYYYSPAGDGNLEDPGNTSGEGVNGVWFLAKEYSVALANDQLVGLDGNNYTDNYEIGESVSQFFVDGEGNTIYIFIRDYKDQNNFTKPDFSNDGAWPIFYEEIKTLPSTLDASDFGEIDIHGEKQMTYKGWPLYYFGQDENRGDTKGVSVPAPGVWPIANINTDDAPVAPTIMLTDNETFGSILTDAQGRSLYYFTRDVDGTSKCAGGCLSAWPIYYTEEIILKDGDELNISNFSTITLSDGTTMQTTYKGWPLYYFSPAADGVIEDAGATAGDGVNNVWYIAKPDFNLMIADAQLIGNDGKNYKSDYTEGDGVTKYFVDAMGRTLYLFDNDSKDTNNFTNPDFSNDVAWPIFYTEIINLPSGMNKDDFGEITVHGKKQLTFKGWPVYYFGGDSDRGDNKGVSVPVPGKWPILNNDTQAAL